MSSSSKPATCSVTRARWSATSRKYFWTSGSTSWHRGSLGELLHRAQQRGHRPLELQHLALELVDPARVGRVRRSRREDVGLDLVDVALQAVDDGQVVVDDLVGDGVQHRGGALGEQLACLAPSAVPQRAQRTVAAVPDGDGEVGSGEHHQLAGVHHLAAGGELVVLDVADGLEDGEQDVVVRLDLGALVRVHRVLDGQRVQPERCGDARRTPPRSARADRSRLKPPPRGRGDGLTRRQARLLGGGAAGRTRRAAGRRGDALRR